MKLSILFVNSIGKTKWGGGEKWLIQTALGLHNLGHKVTIASRKGSEVQKRAESNGLSTINISYNTDFALVSALRFKSYFSKNKVDVAICCLNRDVRIMGLASRLNKNRTKILARQGVQLIKDKWKYKETFTKLCDGIITNSQSIKRIYDGFGWWGTDFVKVIYNGVKINDTNDLFDFSKYADINSETKIIFSAGRLSTQKGFEYLIDAAALAKEQNKDWRFFIAGSGKEYDTLNRQISDNKLDGYIHLIGFFNDIIPLLKSSSVFVMPSLYEGMPNVLLESMASETPIVATRVNGAEELVLHHKTGFAIETKNPQDIYDKLCEVFDDYSLAQQYAVNAKKLIEEQFSVSKSIANVEEFIYSRTKENGN